MSARRERGFALLVVLWSVALLALLVSQVTASGRAEVLLATNLRGAAVVQAAADGAVAEAVFHALDSSTAHWRADGSVHTLRPPGASVALRLDNEAGKVDLNSAPPELLAALLRALGTDTTTAARLAAAIADWRFVDAQRQDGAKAAAYRAAGRSYAPPEEAFQSLDEAGLVLGMTPALLARLRPHVSVFHTGLPDIRLASPLVRGVLEGLGLAVPATDTPEESTLAITGTATGAGGTRFVRHAVVKLGVTRDGGLFRVLAWEGAAE